MPQLPALRNVTGEAPDSRFAGPSVRRSDY